METMMKINAEEEEWCNNPAEVVKNLFLLGTRSDSFRMIREASTVVNQPGAGGKIRYEDEDLAEGSSHFSSCFCSCSPSSSSSSSSHPPFHPPLPLLCSF
jgi:hypothetical protein